MAGAATLTDLSNAIMERFAPTWDVLMDEDDEFIGLLEKESWGKATYDFIVELAQYSPVWSANEAQQSSFISAVWATDGVGSATNFLAPQNHPVVRAQTPIRFNYAAVQVSGAAKAAMTGKPNAYVAVTANETKKTMMNFRRKLNQQALWNSTTLNNPGKDMDGVGVIFQTGAGHTYAGINTGTVVEAAPAVDAATTSIAIAPMQTMLNKLEYGTDLLGTGSTIRDAKVKRILTSPAQYFNYGNLLTAYRRYAPKDKLDGTVTEGRLTFSERPIIPVRRFPNGTMVFDGADLLYVELLPIKMEPLGDIFADADAYRIKTYSQVVARNRKKLGIFNALT